MKPHKYVKQTNRIASLRKCICSDLFNELNFHFLLNTKILTIYTNGLTSDQMNGAQFTNLITFQMIGPECEQFCGPIRTTHKL